MEGPEHLNFILFVLENQTTEIDTLYLLEISRWLSFRSLTTVVLQLF